MGPETEVSAIAETARERPQIYLLLGPEGSGKTTQAELLAESLGIPFFSTGNTLRAIAADENDQSEIAKLVRKMFSDHVYLDKDNLHAIMSERLTQPDMARGFVVDGMLRTDGETRDFPNFLKSIGKGNAELTVISLRNPVWLGVQRIVGRSRDDHDSVESARNRLRNYYTGAKSRLSLARQMAKESGGRYLSVKAEAGDERKDEIPDSETKARQIKEVHERILEALGKNEK